jgi:putative spermidine/putrescine transport system permease protein
MRRGLARLFARSRRLRLFSSLSAPLVWLVGVYIGSLLLLLATSFFTFNTKTNKPDSPLTGANVSEAFGRWQWFRVVGRSVGVAAAVTVLCIAVAVPVAFFLAKVAGPRLRRGLVVAFLLPLWAGYLVKGYALKAVFAQGSKFGAGGSGGFLQSYLGWSPGTGMLAVILTLAYLWLPYMILPIYSGMERLPDSLLDASGDLGAKPGRTFRSVVMPAVLPSIAAGSIFTFSLSLGDYIVVKIMGGKIQLIGNLIERTLLAPNQPLAAAYTLWPVLIMFVYLFAMRAAGAFESL